MAITYQSAGAVASVGSGNLSCAYPASIAAGDLLVLFVGLHPSSANGGTLTTPSGWTLGPTLGGSNVGGYSTTNGTDTGNCRIWALYKTADGTETGNLAVTLGASSASWGQINRLSAGAGNTWDVAGTTGSDTTSGNVSITGAADPGIAANDYILGAFADPTNAATFSAEALSATGVTFGTVTEISEPAIANNNHVGGFTIRAAVSSGTSTAAPTMTATAGGTTTNARGPGIILRIREVVPQPGISVSGAPTVAGGSGTAASSITVTVNAAYNGLFVFVTDSPSTGVTGATCPAVPGGFQLINFGTSSTGSNYWLLYGTATSTGSTTITLTASGSFNAFNRVVCQQFATDIGASASWSVDGGGTNYGYVDAPSSTSVALPSLTPSDTGMAYLGYVSGAGTPSGVTSGFTRVTATSTISVVTKVNCPVSAQSPVVTQSSPFGVSPAMALVIRDSSGAAAKTNLFMPFFMG